MPSSALQSNTHGSGICSVTRAQLGDRVGVDELGADPADLAVDARAARPLFARPPRPPAWAARTTAAPTSRTAARSRAPGSRTCAAGRSRGTGRTAPARSRRAARAAPPAPVSVEQRLLALFEVGVRERDHRFVEVRVVRDLAHVDRERVAEVAGDGVELDRRQRRHAAAHDGGRRRRGIAESARSAMKSSTRRRRPVAVERHAGGVRRVPAATSIAAGCGRRVVELGRAARSTCSRSASPTICCSISSIFALTPLSGLAPLSALRPSESSMRDEPPSAASCSLRQALAAHLAQHVELALAHEVVAPLALDHRLQLALGVARSRALPRPARRARPSPWSDWPRT